MGVTRLSLGVENFDDRILELNGRAHRSPEIGRAYEAARALGFPQINIDLIAGMLGETDANWRDCIERTLALEPDSVTIYQMELPYNTTISGDLLKGGGQFAEPVADWADEAALGAGGVRGARARRLSRRQRLHRGQESVDDEVRLSRSAVAGRRPGRPRRRVVRPHQRRARAEPRHVGDVSARRSSAARFRSAAPIGRRDEERLIREFVLQLKRGSIRPVVLRARSTASTCSTRFRGALALAARRTAISPRPSADRIALTREGLMRVDVLLPRFFLPEHAGIRYT